MVSGQGQTASGHAWMASPALRVLIMTKTRDVSSPRRAERGAFGFTDVGMDAMGAQLGGLQATTAAEWPAACAHY